LSWRQPGQITLRSVVAIDRPHPETGTLVRDFQLVITVKLPLTGPVPEEHELTTAEGHLRRRRQALDDLQLRPRQMTADTALHLLNLCLARGPNATWRHSDVIRAHGDLLLAEQAVDSDLDLSVDRDGLWLGTTRLAVLSVKVFPA
jgi:conjugal transfer ATP-binding protein TraC